MASLSLARPHWSLQLSKSSRTFTVSFTSFAAPQRHESRRLHSRTSDRIRSSRSGFSSSQPANGPSIRSMFTSTHPTRAYQAVNTAGAKSATSPPSPPASAASTEANKSSPGLPDLTSGLSDQPVILDEGDRQIDWANSFHGLSTQPFSKEAAEVLMQSVDPQDVEIKPDGIIYLPEIKYRRILNKAFGPGGWGLAPRGETIVTAKSVTREYALVAHGRLVSVARGEQDYFSPEGIPTATEGCKSNAMMRCCKDLGVVSELWDPRWIRKFLNTNAKEVFVEHVVTKRTKKIWMRKDDEVRYPFKHKTGGFSKPASQGT